MAFSYFLVLYRFENDKAHMTTLILFFVLCVVLIISGLIGLYTANQSKCAKDHIYGTLAHIDCLVAIACGVANIALSITFYFRYKQTGKIPLIQVDDDGEHEGQ